MSAASPLLFLSNLCLHHSAGSIRKKRGENAIFGGKRVLFGKISIDSGSMRVTRGGFGAKAPSLAARPVPCNGRGRKLVELSKGCYNGPEGIPRVASVNKATPVSLGYSLSVFNKNSTPKREKERLPLWILVECLFPPLESYLFLNNG